MENTDPRYVRSRLALRTGLLELAREDPTKITVSLLCEHTGIDRATFYRHFDSIDALVADTIADLADSAARTWDTGSLGRGDQVELAEDILAAFLQQIVDNWALHQWALSVQGSAGAILGLLDRFERSVDVELHALHVEAEAPWDELTAGFIGGSTFGAVIFWLRHPTPPVPPRSLAEWILRDAWKAWNRIEPPLSS